MNKMCDSQSDVRNTNTVHDDFRLPWKQNIVMLAGYFLHCTCCKFETNGIGCRHILSVVRLYHETYEYTHEDVRIEWHNDYHFCNVNSAEWTVLLHQRENDIPGPRLPFNEEILTKATVSSAEIERISMLENKIARTNYSDADIQKANAMNDGRVVYGAPSLCVKPSQTQPTITEDMDESNEITFSSDDKIEFPEENSLCDDDGKEEEYLGLKGYFYELLHALKSLEVKSRGRMVQKSKATLMELIGEVKGKKNVMGSQTKKTKGRLQTSAIIHSELMTQISKRQR